ncbi:hypothetical protein VTO42DRAFT_2752 [Malbranchea cinnamomea]
MRSSGLSPLFLLSSLCLSLAGSLAAAEHRLPDFGSRSVKHLSPASLSPTVSRQRGSWTNLLQQKASFDFIDANDATHPDSTFVTRLTVQGKHEVLALEDLDGDLLGVTCSESSIELAFNSAKTLEKVARTLEPATPFIIVTSHHGCNNDDERAPHLITNVTVRKGDKLAILSKESVEWNEAFTRAEISFSRQPQLGGLQRRYANQKRQDTEPTPPQGEPDRAFPTAEVTASAVPTDSATELNFELLDQAILPPDFAGADLLPLPPFPDGVTLKCKKCSLEGEIDLSAGTFEFEEVDDFIDGINNTINFFKHGAVQLDVDGLFAHIELALEFDWSVGLFNYSVPLPTIPMSPFSIPGVAEFGIIFNPQILINLDLNQAMEFSYGFNMSVPDNSGFTIDIGDLGNSSITGFGDTTFHALPFQSSEGITSLVFTLSFSPEILLGVRSSIGKVNGGVGAFFNLPSVTVNVTQLDGVDHNCEPVAETEDESEDSEGDDLESVIDNLIGDFTHIVPSIELNLGPLAQLEVGIGDWDTSLATELTVVSTVFTLPTACLAFDPENGEYQPAEALATSAAEDSQEDREDGGDGGDGEDGEGSDDGDGEGGTGAAGRVSAEESRVYLWLCTALASLFVVVGIGL